MKPAQFFLFLVKLLPSLVVMMLILGLVLPLGSVKATYHAFGQPIPVTDRIMAWGVIITVIIFSGTWLSSRAARKRPAR
jgi:fumarate reductase subunit D